MKKDCSTCKYFGSKDEIDLYLCSKCFSTDFDSKEKLPLYTPK